MRLRLLMASLLDRLLYTRNMKTNGESTVHFDAERTALIGDEHTIHEQTLRARAFAEEIGQSVVGEPPSRWWKSDSIR